MRIRISNLFAYSNICKTDTKTKLKSTPLQGLKPFSNLNDEHPAKQYLLNRKLPTDYFDRLYYCDKFQTYVNRIRPGTFESLNKKYEHPRLIIPFYDVDNQVFAIQGRAFGKEQPKYITIKFDKTKQKIYGLDRIDLNKPVMITEGPIDSLFLDNAIALAGADADINIVNIQHQQCTMIFDNEPRNEQIVNRMIKAVDKNLNLVVWPKSLRVKDINDMILSGKSATQVQSIISNSTYSGLTALQHINNWKRI